MSTAATNIYAKDWRDGKTYHEWNMLDSDSVTLIAGDGYNSQNWVTAIRFELESYASSVTFTWYTGDRHSGKGVLNYKLTDREDSSLESATYATAGDGVFSPTLDAYTRNSLTVARLLAPGTYYLYLWQSVKDGGFTSLYWRSTGSYSAAVSYEAVAGTASTVVLTGGVLGNPVTMHITRSNASFTHTLMWSFAGHSGVIADKTRDTVVSWTPDAEIFGGYIPTATSGMLTVSCATYYDTEQIGTTTVSLTLSVPSDAAPTLSKGWAEVSHTNSGTSAAGLSACVAGHSKAVVTFDAAKVTARYGAQIKGMTAEMGAASITGSGTIGTVAAEENSITLTATDTRGKSTSQTVKLTAHPYRQPVLGGVTVFRCDSAGAEDDSGAFYSAKAAVTYSDAGGEISCALTAAVKAVGGSYGAETPLAPGVTAVLGGFLSDTVTYIVRIQAQDTLGNTASVEVTIPTAAVALHIREGGDGMGLGKYNEAAGYVDSAWPIKMNGHKITGLGAPTDDGDAVNKVYVDRAVPPSASTYRVTQEFGGTVDGEVSYLARMDAENLGYDKYRVHLWGKMTNVTSASVSNFIYGLDMAKVLAAINTGFGKGYTSARPHNAEACFCDVYKTDGTLEMTRRGYCFVGIYMPDGYIAIARIYNEQGASGSWDQNTMLTFTLGGSGFVEYDIAITCS